MRIKLVCVLVFLLSMGSLFAEPQGESPYAPSVRYWSNEQDSTLTAQPMIPLRSEPKLLVLLYHNVVFGRTGNVYNRDLYNFENDLLFVKRNYTLTNFKQLLTSSNDTKTDKAIITFDDGDLSLYAIVFPLFKAYELEATIFLVPSYIGEVGYMSWDQVREMSDYRTGDGRKLFYFESHSQTHRMMGDLGEEEIRWELQQSKQIIEEEVGEPVTVLALPFGSGAGDERIISAAYDLGYQAIRTSKPEARLLTKINPWMIGAMNVENYSSDVLVQNVLTLMGKRK
ncbi:polysaccharide deacetylase family protein [uncultured Sphaerochaeta sp.]|uniref:polysaccharide deacetylase family protein n=1 Tax=uncultured Sphaerochaeta sp. TaxID=886478 RepID=UPI002A0A6690|nr:polysaccharide deacetylase family protein [uncultured Sphaerochaeta sp.]